MPNSPKVFNNMRSQVKLTITLILLLSCVFGCSKEIKKTQIDQDSLIVAFGDSLTKGTGAKPEDSYPSFLQKTLGVDVLNKGIPGETTGEGFLRLEKLLESISPDLVILCHGGNDILKGLSKTKLENNLAKMIELVQSHGAQVILVGVPKPSISLSPLPLYEKLADKYMLASDLTSLSDLLERPSMKSDRVHLNGDGYRELALNLSNIIEVL